MQSRKPTGLQLIGKVLQETRKNMVVLPDWAIVCLASNSITYHLQPKKTGDWTPENISEVIEHLFGCQNCPNVSDKILQTVSSDTIRRIENPTTGYNILNLITYASILHYDTDDILSFFNPKMILK